MIKAGILGASGYVGGELLRVLAAHPSIDAARLFGASAAGKPIASVHPHLGSTYADAQFETYDGTVDGLDILFAALPHGHSQEMAPAILATGIPFVDLGADFRLDNADDYARWYGEVHKAPSLIGEFVYGIPELNRIAIRSAKAVAAAGCYATAAILALKPLLEAELIKAKGIIVDAASGVSGAGREAKETTGFCTVTESLTAYGLLNHRHTAEMQMALDADVLFTPHLAPMSRGILATSYADAARDMLAGEPLEALGLAYAAEPFIHVGADVPATKWVSGSNGVRLTARYDERTGKVIVISAIDNLGKGAAGQMVQCANLMLGLDEAAGLTSNGVYP